VELRRGKTEKKIQNIGTEMSSKIPLVRKRKMVGV